MSDENVDVTAEMRFDDLEPKQAPVYVGSKVYALREPSEAAAVAYRNVITSAVKIIDGEVASIGAVGDAEPTLVSRCLYRATADGKVPLDSHGMADDRHLVPVSWIKSWPASLVKQIFDRAKAMSPGLVDDQAETPEQIKKQIDKLQKKLTKLEAKEGKDTSPLEETAPSDPQG